MSDDVRMQMFLDQMKAQMKERGWVGQLVAPFATDPDEFVPFAYSIGFTELDHPEIVLVGMNHESMNAILWMCYEFIYNGRKFTDGEVSNDFLQAKGGKGDIPVKFRRVDPLAHDYYQLGMAARIFGESGFEAMQMLVADRNGVFPDDDAYDIVNTILQPLLPRKDETDVEEVQGVAQPQDGDAFDSTSERPVREGSGDDGAPVVVAGEEGQDPRSDDVDP